MCCVRVKVFIGFIVSNTQFVRPIPIPLIWASFTLPPTYPFYFYLSLCLILNFTIIMFTSKTLSLLYIVCLAQSHCSYNKNL